MFNPRQFVLWGSAGHAKVLAELIVLKGGKVIAIFDNSSVPSALKDVPMYVGKEGFHSWVESQGGDIGEIAGLVAIGGNRGHDRLAIQDVFHRYGLNVPTICHPNAVVSQTAQLGFGTQVLALANIAADAQLGRACIVNHRASVDHECKLGNGVHLAPGATLCGCVSESDNVFIGAGAIILPRLTIGANSIIGAGAVVTKNVSKGEVVIGNPARPLKINHISVDQ